MIVSLASPISGAQRSALGRRSISMNSLLAIEDQVVIQQRMPMASGKFLQPVRGPSYGCLRYVHCTLGSCRRHTL